MRILNAILTVFFAISSVVFCWGQQIRIVNKSGDGVSYATIYINGKYAAIADEDGAFIISKIKGQDSLTFSAIGYKKKSVLYQNLKSIVELEKVNFLLEEVKISSVKSRELWVGYVNQKETIRTSNLVNSTLWESGLVFRNDMKIRGKILSVKVKAGFVGRPKLPFRVNVYRLDQNGLPDVNLLKNEIVFLPKSQKLKWYEFDISQQEIQIPEQGFCVSLEFLNPSINTYQLNKNYSPVRMGFFSSNYNSVERTNESGGWFTSKISTLAAGIKLQVE